MFAKYLGVNSALYVLWTVAWGLPAIAGLGDLGEHDGPPLLYAAVALLVVFIFAGFALIIQVLLYLAIVYVLPRRRLLSVLLSPLAVGLLFVVGAGASLAIPFVELIAGAAFGASLWFPSGPRAWWEGRPVTVAVVASLWVAIVAAIAFVQPLPAGVQLEAAGTISDGERVAQYRLECEYDRAGRIRKAREGPSAHPGGVRACWILEDSVESLRSDSLQRRCPQSDRRGRFVGRLRGETFRFEVLYADCEYSNFADGELDVLLPIVR